MAFNFTLKDVAVGPEYQAVVPEGILHSFDNYDKG